MAFKRENIPNSTDNFTGATYSPGNVKSGLNKSDQNETTDISNVEKRYSKEENITGGKLHSGTHIPTDMTVKLVRADSSLTEIIITFIFTSTLTIAGIFIGAWVSVLSNNEEVHWSIIVSTTFLIILSIVLIIWYIVLKIKQFNNSILLPNSTFEQFNIKDTTL